MTLTRRTFLASGLGLAACGRTALPHRGTFPVVDFHVHLFGVGDGETGCYLSADQREHGSFGFLRRVLRLDREGDLDRQYVERLTDQLRASSLDRAVLLAQDRRYDGRGLPLDDETHFYVPNDYLFEVCAREPELFVPCVSINPMRRDAIDEVSRCAERGARVVKVHPPAQLVDPARAEFEPFYRRIAEHDLILMVHTGGEHATPIEHVEWGDPARLRLALDAGCTVVAAHAGFGSFLDRDDWFRSLVDLVARYANIYCDTAVLGSMFRWRNLRRLLAEERVVERTIHASDWPFPSNAMVFWNQLAPGDLGALLEERNLLERDLRLKRALGFTGAYFTLGARLLGLGQ